MIYVIPTDTCFWIWCEISDIESYEKIYKIKNRTLDKPLAIMVWDFNWLETHTDLNDEQISFLKNYNHPFTVLTNCDRIKMLLSLEQADFCYKNKEKYEKIAFRIANNEIQKKLIDEIWPIFLTSANLSWDKEIYDIIEIKNIFKPYLKDIKIFWENSINKIPPSDIFEFVWDSLELNYLRKNY